jgi:hypothetical protein
MGATASVGGETRRRSFGLLLHIAHDSKGLCAHAFTSSGRCSVGRDILLAHSAQTSWGLCAQPPLSVACFFESSEFDSVPAHFAHSAGLATSLGLRARKSSAEPSIGRLPTMMFGALDGEPSVIG